MKLFKFSFVSGNGFEYEFIFTLREHSAWEMFSQMHPNAKHIRLWE